MILCDTDLTIEFLKGNLDTRQWILLMSIVF